MLPGCTIHLPQVDVESNKAFANEKRILDTVLQLKKVLSSGSVAF
jgi:hypothetical protein